MSAQLRHEIERLNADCTCVTLDLVSLCRAVEQVVGDPAFCRDLAATHPHLLSAQPMFVSRTHADRMEEIIRSIEAVSKQPSYRSAVLEFAPEVARFEPGPVGVFMGYDFHLGPDGPKLIEINTNAGGALINAYLLQAQRTCCRGMPVAEAMRFDLSALVAEFISNFEMEWRRQGRVGAIRSIAIVDQSPAGQYLYPEFVLFQRLFQAHGVKAVIAAPEELSHRDNALWREGLQIDIVYNRLTDFYFALPENGSLRAAYLAGEVVATPSPRIHALFANKQNLSLLTEEKTLRKWGIAADLISSLLSGIPKTVLLTRDNADECWARRNRLFFKPSAGFGGKAAYRGDKITRKVWADILSGRYVAQEIVPPSARTVAIDGAFQSMKADLRNYTYDGKVQFVAARLYRGQTTNFRTPGGGFAPVFIGDGALAQSCR